MSADEVIRQAIKLLQAGKRAEARELLRRVLAQDQDDALAWAAMVQAAEKREEAIICLKQVLRLKPGDSWATNYLRRLEGPAVQPAPASKHVPPFYPSSVPDVDRSVHSIRPQVSPVRPSESRLDQMSQAIPSSASEGAAAEGQAASSASALSFSPLASLLNHLPWIAVGLCLFACLIAAWYEFLASHPGDAEKVLQASREWTEAILRSDYDAMSDLVCRRYSLDVKNAESMASFLGDFGMAFERQPADQVLRDITYEVLSIKGGRARVRVSGGSFEAVAFLDGAFSGGGDYVMTRELGKWKWCGRE